MLITSLQEAFRVEGLRTASAVSRGPGLTAIAISTGVRTTLVMPGIIRTDMIAGFARARGTRIVGPDKVAAGILDAVRTGREEVFVPRELGPIARLIAGTPPAIGDRLKALLRADSVMTQADMGARAGYREQIDAISGAGPT